MNIFQKSLKSILFHLSAVITITVIIFIFISSEAETYLIELLWSIGNASIIWIGNSMLIMGVSKLLPWDKRNFPRVFTQIGLSIFFTLWLTYFALKFMNQEVYQTHFSAQDFRKGAFLFVGISMLIHTIYFSIFFFKKWQDSLVKSEELKRQNLAIQYQTLKNQINPHFLFNSINTLLALINENKDLAVRYGEYFSKVYRYILDQANEELVDLKSEIDIIKINVRMLESRFGGNLKVSIKVHDKDLSKKIPPLTLHMLLENAIKHNVISKQKPLSVSITSEPDDCIKVVNNLQKRPSSKSTNLGLTNIQNRYKYLTDKNVTIINSGNYFTVRVPLIQVQS